MVLFVIEAFIGFKIVRGLGAVISIVNKTEEFVEIFPAVSIKVTLSVVDHSGSVVDGV